MALEGDRILYDVIGFLTVQMPMNFQVGGLYSEPGGQIYVNGNVVIGGKDYD